MDAEVIPQQPLRNEELGMAVCNPSPGELETGGFLGFTSQTA